MKTIAICNNKGGVGKTAVSMSFAEGLYERGYRTLIIDLDSQMNATKQAGFYDVDGIVTIYDLLTGTDYTAIDAVKKYRHGNILPGDTLVRSAEADMAHLIDPLTMLDNALDSVRENYDFCIIDCPPTLGTVTLNALVAANEVVVVVTPDEPSIAGYGEVSALVDQIKSNKRLNPSIKIAGIVLNEYDSRHELARAADDSLPELAEQTNTRLFQTRIRNRMSIRKAQSAHVSLYDFDPKSEAVDDFHALVEEYLISEGEN